MKMFHRCNAHELEQTLGDGEGQGGLVCCNPWGCEELDRTWQLGKNNMRIFHVHLKSMCILGFVTVMS